MRFHRSLRFRVGLSFALFGGLLSLLLAFSLYIAAHDASRRLIDETLTAEIDDYTARRMRNPHPLLPATVTIRGYVVPQAANDPPVPEALRRLQPGRHEIILNGITYRAAIQDRNGSRYFLLYNETLQNRREARFVMFLVGAIVLMALLSAGGGLWLAGRVIAPVTELARRVSGITPLDQDAPLAQDFPEDELGELARIFDQTLARLRGFIERERAFTADASHELRTPLAVIHGAIEVLLAGPELPGPLRERIVRMERAAVQMSELSEALLLMAREEQQGALADSRCEVEEVLRDTVDKNRYLLNSKSAEVKLEIHASPCLPAERALLFIVLGNLVRNAFSYTERGEVNIRLDPTRVVVTDTGIGIRSTELDHVFQRYYKGAASKGSGIGLSLVKRICDRYGWHVAIDSREGRGTVAQLEFGVPPEKPGAA